MIQTTLLSIDTRNTTYGGKIYPSDFNTDYEGTRNIAARILCDLAFDEQCRRSAASRDRKEQ